MRKFINYFIGGLLLSVVACSSPKATDENSTEKVETKTEGTSYSYDPNGTIVSFTAFKTSDKVGVSGKFLKFDVTPAKESVSNAADILPGLKFSIPVNSIETNDKSRNGKIVEFFFGSMANNENISGEVKTVTNGKAIVNIKMNDISKAVELVAKADENIVVLKGFIDLNDWNGSDAIKTLNDVCKELHTGSDGKSVLWPDVELFIKAKLAK